MTRIIKKGKLRYREKDYDVSSSPDKKTAWRMVHDGETVQCLFKSKGETSTIQTLFESKTKQACLDEIDRLGLIYIPDEGEI